MRNPDAGATDGSRDRVVPSLPSFDGEVPRACRDEREREPTFKRSRKTHFSSESDSSGRNDRPSCDI